MSNKSQCFASSNSTDKAVHSEQVLFTTLYCVIIVLGLFFNVVALWIFQRHIHVRSGTTIYMKNLAIADLLLVCFLPFRINYYHLTKNHSTTCEIATVIFLVNMYTSIFFLACISLDRCVATVLALKVQISRLRRAATWVSVVVWLLTVGFSLPLYLSWKLNSTHVCRVSCLAPIAVTKTLPLIFTLSIGFGLPFCLVLICSLMALVKVRKSEANGSQLLNARKTQNMILANFLVFTVCFLPYHLLLCFYSILDQHSPTTAQLLYQAAQLLASTNAVLDPIVYYFTTEAFQKTNLMRTVCNVLFCRCNRARLESAESPEEHRESYKRASETVVFIDTM